MTNVSVRNRAAPASTLVYTSSNQRMDVVIFWQGVAEEHAKRFRKADQGTPPNEEAC